MEPFIWTTVDGSTVSGLSSIPPATTGTPKLKPLIVGLHGGGYHSEYFNGDANHTAANASRSFGVPFIAIDRPNYGKTSSLLPLPSGTSFINATATRLHTQILPLLWTKVGVPHSCTCIVLLCHSLGVMAGVSTAARHAQDESPEYPLGGVISSGLGHRLHPEHRPGPVADQDLTESITMPIEMKDQVMFQPGTVDDAILAKSEQLNQPMPMAEAAAMVREFVPHWRELWAAHITSPILFVLPELDRFFHPTSEHIDECLRAFTSSKRVEGGVVAGAPHCMELSHWSSGWYTRCFGFAMECAASYAVSQ